MITRHKIISGDSRRMTSLADESVHLVVTSPPYWQLKDYGNRRQIGFHDSYENYINNLNLVWQECYRVLHQGCRLCINIGDQFARAVYYGRYKVIPIRTEIIKFCETIGLDYMGAIIWQKVTTTNTSGGATIMGSFPYPRNGILKLDYEFILIFKKQGQPPKVSKAIKERSKLSTADWNTYFTGHWKFAGEKQDKHLAMFPQELPHRLIRMFSFRGDTVLDPFLGSGTTSLAARILERNSIGYEVNSDFIPIIKNKLNIKGTDASREANYEFLTVPHKKLNFTTSLAALPYRFADPHKLTKELSAAKAETGSSPKLNQKTPQTVIPAKAGIYPLTGKSGNHQNNFGSKVSLNDPGGQIQYFRIKEIISPEKIKLSDGSTINLLGVVEDRGQHKQAMKFLRDKTKGQQVYLKFDKDMENDAGLQRSAYVYLKNRTFLNAHLVKSGFVRIELHKPFKYRHKFTQLYSQARENKIK
jgi:DNA modification methylase/endonuclease YncB( thermonuclease family)